MLRRILIAIGYIGLAALVVAVTIGLVAYGQGYTYNFKTGKLIRTGLVIIQSSPSGAQVTLNGKKLKKKTAYRASFERGSYTFEVTKDGFYPWKKTLNVIPSEVTLAEYALLVPRNPRSITLDTQTQIVAQSISKDHRHLAYATAGAEAGVFALDLGGGRPAKIYTPKAATADQPAETVTDVTWSDDASHVLIVSQIGAVPTHHLMTAGGSGAVNLTQQYGFNFTGLKFSAGNWRQLYWISPDGLRRLDVGTQAVSGVLAEKVSQFQIAGDRVLYVQTTDLGRTLWSIDGRGSKQELIQALPDSDSYALAFTTYRGQEELAVVPSKTRVGTLYSGVYGTNPIAKTVAREVTEAAFSPDGHFLTFSSSTHITTYDLERSAIGGTLVSYEAAGINNLTKLTWFDNFHLLTNQAGRLVLMEFDGANALGLGALQGSLPAYGTADLKSIVAFQADGATTRVVEMTIKP